VWRSAAGGTVLSREPQALEEAAHGRHPDLQPPRLLERATELFQCRIGLFPGQVPHEGQGRAIAAGLSAAPMGPRRHLPGGAPLPQRLQARVADAEQGRQGPWRTEVLIVSTQDVLS
jgi:hypothetical protein